MSEQEIIAKYFSHHLPGGNVEIGIGDDAAVVIPPDNSRLAVTTDTLNEGIHFHSNCMPEDLGHKALAVSLSDLAAMGAKPLWATINLSLPTIDHDWLKNFTQGLFSLADQHNTKIIGGDLVKGPLSVSIQVIGCLDSNNVLTRSNAEVDDLVYVSGTLGDAALGLKLHECKMDLDLSPVDLDYISLRFNRPEPRISIGLEIVKIANAAIDSSDGLLIDLQRILSMSNVGAIIDVDKLPLSKVVQRNMNKLQDLSLQLTGGEDYELIFTVNKKYASKVDHISKITNCPLTEIGRIVQNKDLKLLKDNSPINLPSKLGFDHFS